MGITTETGAKLNAFVMHRCAVKPVTDTTSKNGKSVFVGILISKSYPAHKRLKTVCIITNQKSMHVKLNLRVSNFVAIAVAAKQIGRRNAAINAQLIVFRSGLATNIMPTKPIAAAKSFSFVSNSPKKMGARKTIKRGLGDRSADLLFDSVSISSGNWVYADLNGWVVSDKELIF